jgi:hypothetical protein
VAKTEIRQVRDLPFPQLDRFTLLHLSPDRVDLDLENYGFGFGRVDKIALVEQEGDLRTQLIEDALVLALHTFEQSSPVERDIEIAFWLDEDEYYEEEDPEEDDLVVLAPLSVFLRKRLGEFIAAVSPPGSRPIREVVLALCNPFNTVLDRPEGLTSPPIRYALGFTTSRMESDRAGRVWDPDATLCLDAPEWLRLP